MKKAILYYAIICLLLVPSMAAAQSGLTKYLKPAQITELDWIVMRLNLSLSETSFDELLQSYSLQALKTKIPKISLTTLVNDKVYKETPNHTISEQFIQTTEMIFEMIQRELPEADLKKDFEACFYNSTTKHKIAVYKNGKLSFTH